MTERFISVAEVLDRVGFSRTHLYRKINAGSFPSPVPLGPQKVAFLESEILQWMDERLRARAQNEGMDARRERATRSVEHAARMNRLEQPQPGASSDD